MYWRCPVRVTVSMKSQASSVSAWERRKSAQVAMGGSRKLTHLRARPRATVVVRVGWQWVAAEGPVDLIGPDDSADGVDRDGVRLLLRAIFTAAGGSHDDWDAYDRVMADERRTAVLLTPQRIYANG